ncbi:hypothetical protein [Leyella lascolaii]|uniref:hypothetical protein n=1 Tax=Leyella lascolaii TaxID=1776379 RepID=UPI0013DD5D79|nr:hypothetical protein [Leyella lascolaii]
MEKRLSLCGRHRFALPECAFRTSGEAVSSCGKGSSASPKRLFREAGKATWRDRKG